MKKLERCEGDKAALYTECLSHMANVADDSSFYPYTMEWIEGINRGGLFVINDATFMFFKAVQIKTQETLPKHLAKSSNVNKATLIKTIIEDDDVQFHCCMIVKMGMMQMNFCRL